MDRILDTRLWNNYLDPTSLRAVTKLAILAFLFCWKNSAWNCNNKTNPSENYRIEIQIVLQWFSLRDFLKKLYYVIKIQWQNVSPSGDRTRASHSLWFQVQHYPFYTYLTFACKTETLGSLHSHALLIPLKSSKSKYQVVHEQKFKDLLSSTCQVSVERIVLTWNQRSWEA